jgi:hypothetical protein
MSAYKDIQALQQRCDTLEQRIALLQRVILAWNESFTRGSMPQPKSVSETVAQLIQ